MRKKGEVSLAPLDGRSGKYIQGHGRSSEASPSRHGSHASGPGPRAAPFPPVSRPGTSGQPYLTGGPRRVGASFDSPGPGDASPSGSLPRLDSVGALAVSGGGSGSGYHRSAATGGGGGAGTRLGRGHTAPGMHHDREKHRERGHMERDHMERERESSSAGGAGGGGLMAAPAVAPPPPPAPPITWAQVRDAQQHAWAESSGYYRIPSYAISPSYSPPEAQSSFADPSAAAAAIAATGVAPSVSWDDGGGAGLVGGPSTLSLGQSNSYIFGMGVPYGGGPPASGYGRSGGGAGPLPARVAYGFPIDLAELDRGLRDRERDLLGGFNRSSWSVGASGTTGSGAPGSPAKGHRDRDALSGGGAAGLLAFEPLVGPQFGMLGLLEGPLGAGGGAAAAAAMAAAAASGASAAQLQAMQVQQQQVHTLQRRTLMLRLPHSWENLGLELPAMVVRDAAAGGKSGGDGSGGGDGAAVGGACLLILPSDKPATRAEAMAVETLLLDMMRDPHQAAARAAAWRADVLGTLCSEAIACLHEAGQLRKGGAAGGGGGGGGGGAAAAGGQAAPDGAGKWQIRGLDSVELHAPAILGPFTTLLQPSLQAHTAAIEAQRAGLATAHSRRMPYTSTSAHPSSRYGGISGGGGGGEGGEPGGGGGGGHRRHHRGGPEALANGGGRAANGGVVSGLVASEGRGAGAAGGGGSGGLLSPQASASLTVGACICMADIIRQVEVQCCERGRALTSAWNAFVTAHADSVEALRERTAGLQKEVAQLNTALSERRDFARELELLEFLKRENARFKSREAELLAKGLLTMQASPGARDGSRLVVKAGGALGEAVDAELTSRIARLRWRHATTTLGTQTKKVGFVSGAAVQPPQPVSARLAAGGAEAEAMAARISLLQRLTLAVERAERKRAAARYERRAAEMAAARNAALASVAPSVADVMAAALASGPGLGLKLLEGLDPEDTAKMLASLSVEAQVMLLASLPELRRAEVITAMSDADRAQVVVVMSSGMRVHTARMLGRGMWLSTMRAIKDNPPLAARLLAGMEQQEATDELLSWSGPEQQDALAAMDEPTAARLLAAMPAEQRQRLLTGLPAHLAANIVSAMQPPPAAASLDALEVQRAVAILMAMDPSAAAALLQELGTDKAALALMIMDNLEARHSILESMLPRLAAETVLEMDDRAAAPQPSLVLAAAGAAAAAAAGAAAEGSPGALAGGEPPTPPRPGGTLVPVTSLAALAAPAPGSASLRSLPSVSQGTFPGTDALGEMPSPSADKIMGFMNVQDKAAILSRMDPERAAELLSLMSPAESVALLACLSDAGASLVAEAMRQEEREALVKVLTDAGGVKRGRNAKGGKAARSKSSKQPANAKLQQALNAAAAAGAAASGLAAPPAATNAGGGAAAAATAAVPSPAAAQPQTASAAETETAALARSDSMAGGESGGGAVTIVASGGGGGGFRGIKAELAASMSAAVGRRIEAFIEEDSEDEGAYDYPYSSGGAAGGDGTGPWLTDGGRQGDWDGADAGSLLSAAATSTGTGLSPRPDFDVEDSPRRHLAAAVAASASASADATPRSDTDGWASDGAEAVGAAAAEGRPYMYGSTVDGAGETADGGPPSVSTGRISPAEGAQVASAASSLRRAGPGTDSPPLRHRRPSEGDAHHKPPLPPHPHGALPVAASLVRQRLHRQSVPEGPPQASFARRGPAGRMSDTRGFGDVGAPQHRGSSTSPVQLTGGAGGTRAAVANVIASSGGRTGGAAGGRAGGGAAAVDEYGNLRMAFRISRQRQQLLAQGPAAAGGHGAAPGSAGLPDIAQFLRSPTGAAAAGGGGGAPARPSTVGSLAGALREPVALSGIGGPALSQLGSAPKNARLANALLLHRNARPRPRGWLMAVVESVYKDGESLLRRVGRMEALRRQSVPEMVFAHFSNKYGQRSLVDEYAACLANTLAQHRAEDLRLETFARFLSEEWDFATFIDFLTASNLALQPSKALCVEYPREGGREGQYPWLCTHKAAAIADAVLGPRSGAMREAFNAALMAVSVPAEDSDVEKLKRDARYVAAAADAAAGTGPPLPERFFRLPRPRFLALLAAEASRINAAVARLARHRYEQMAAAGGAGAAAGSGGVPAAAVPGYLAAVVAAAEAAAGHISQTVNEAAAAFVANALTYQQDPAATSAAAAAAAESAGGVGGGAAATGAGGTASPVPSAAAADAVLSQEAWVAASVQCQLLRDHVKAHLLKPMRLGSDGALGGGDADDDSPEALLGGFLLGLTRRHTKLLLGRFKGAAGGGAGGSRHASGAGDGADAAAVVAVAEMAAAVERAASGGEKLRAYLQLLLAIIKHQVASAVALLTGPDGSATEAGSEEVEAALCRLEDCALIMAQQAGYLLQAPSLELQFDLVRRAPTQRRIFHVGRQLLTWRQYDTTVRHLAAMVVQSCWRRHRRALRAAAAAAAAEVEAAAVAAVTGHGPSAADHGAAV